jgi:glycosyltransferase involved in cell wall biosynthesis
MSSEISVCMAARIPMTKLKACSFAGVVVEPQTKIGEMKKLCFVATIPAAVYAFLRGHIRASAEKWAVKIISNPFGAELLSDLDAQFIPLAIERNPSPWRDLLALIQLVILFRRERFDLVNSITPKAGLLSMLAAYLAGVPNRMHTFTGQVWANKRGWKRGALKMFDKLIVLFATHILVDSLSQLDFLVSEGVLTQVKGMVIGHGSICGVDPDRFYPDAQTKSIVRHELGINQNATVLLFLGRLKRDKGMLDLAAAFAEISQHKPDTVLLLGLRKMCLLRVYMKFVGRVAINYEELALHPILNGIWPRRIYFVCPVIVKGLVRSLLRQPQVECRLLLRAFMALPMQLKKAKQACCFRRGMLLCLLKPC